MRGLVLVMKEHGEAGDQEEILGCLTMTTSAFACNCDRGKELIYFIQNNDKL